MLKSKASKILKRITFVLASMAKAKTLALKDKTNALRTRLMIFSLLRDKKTMMSSISHKLQAMIGHNQEHENKKQQQEEEEVEDRSKAIVLYNHSTMSIPNPTQLENADDGDQENGLFYGYGYGYRDENGDDEDKFPDLTHCLFDEDLDFEGSVIDKVKNSKKEGEEFKLEDEIDQVADLFIRKFHRQIRMQKQLSIKEKSRNA